ncbi:MAG: glycosyltransferase family 4 protein [Spirochaetales bacterium]|nr:glycosyltransferase family 4 protein [Spirochaetales bacterium]
MRICLVIYGSLEQLSGGYLYDRQVVAYLRERGVRVEILGLPPCPYLLCPLPLPGLLGPRRELRRLLHGADGARHFDAVVIDELVHPSVLSAVPPRRRAGAQGPALVPLVHHLKSREPAAAPVRWLARTMEARLLARARAVLVNSRVTAETVRELIDPDTPLYVCPPGSDLLPGLEAPAPASAPCGSAAPASAAAVAEDHAVRLLVTGNLIRRKGHDLLLRMLGELREMAWKLRVVGRSVDRGYRRRLEALQKRLGLEGRVEYAGELTGAELTAEYRQAELFVFPSRYEGYGISLAEAVRAGLPFVAFAAGAVAEVTGGRGLLFPPGDLAGFTQGLRRLIADPEARREAAELSRELRRELPGWIDTGRAVHQALQEILGRD